MYNMQISIITETLSQKFLRATAEEKCAVSQKREIITEMFEAISGLMIELRSRGHNELIDWEKQWARIQAETLTVPDADHTFKDLRKFYLGLAKDVGPDALSEIFGE